MTELHRPAPSRQAWPGLLAAALLAFWLIGLGSAPLFDVDEGAFAEASRELLASGRDHGDWWHTTLNGEDRFDKPIGVYWLQAAGLALFGNTEFAVRLPSALCAWIWCLATAAFALPRFGARAALLSAAIIATSVGPMLIGRAATADALLNLLLALSLFDLWRALARPGEQALVPRRRAFLWIALGVLVKGPVAVLIPGAALLLWAALSPRSDAGWRKLRDLLADPWAWALGLAVALPWYVYALQRHGQAFIDGFFVRHNLDRFSGPLEGHGGSLGYFALVLPLLMLPWTPLLWPVLRGVRTAWADPGLRWLIVWSGFVLVFFSLSGTKLPHYGLYGLTPLVLLTARAAVDTLRPARVTLQLALLAAALMALVALSGAPLAALLAARVQDPQWTARFQAAAALPAVPWALWLGCGVGLALAAGLMFLTPRRGPRVNGLLVAAAVSALAWTQWAMPWWGQLLQGPVRSLAIASRGQGTALTQWRLHQPSVAFYRGQASPRREPADGEVALVRSDRFDALSAADKACCTLLAQDRGFALVSRNARP